MELEAVQQVVGTTPYMTLERAERFRGLLGDNPAPRVLELGFAHGAGTCYFAGMVEPAGSVVAIDTESALERRPEASQLLGELGLEHVVELIHERTSYNWRLMRMLEDGQGPRFDFVYLDGAHDWTVDGFAFYLVDKLLKPGGWLVLDDLPWTYATSSIADEPRVQAMAEDEQREPHVRKIWDLLVKTHPNYGNFAEEDKMAIAQKLGDDQAGEVRTVVVRPTLRQLADMTVEAVRHRLPGSRG